MKNWGKDLLKAALCLLVYIFYSFLPYNPQVYLLGYGAKLFRFNLGGSSSHGDASQESDVSSAESITGQKRNYLSSV